MMDLQIVAEGLQFPEGPVVLADGSVLVVEIRRRTVSRVRPNGTVEVVAETGGGPNDLVFDRHGGFWFTDHGKSTPEYRDHGALYYAKADGSGISLARGELTAPNGVGLSPDEAVLYWSDTITARVWAMEIAAPGQLAPPPFPWAPGRAVATLPGHQMLDSLKVEADGKVCVGTLLNGGITVFDPNGTTEHVPIPDLAVTNLCFGGPDMRDVWITASASGRLYKARWPRPGLKLAFNA
jgi:gluconolactonase